MRSLRRIPLQSILALLLLALVYPAFGDPANPAASEGDEDVFVELTSLVALLVRISVHRERRFRFNVNSDFERL
jgi:hypothetical protein